MKNKILSLSGILLIVVGIGLLLYNYVPDIIINKNTSENQQVVQEVTPEKIEENKESEGVIDFSAIDNVDAVNAINNAEIVTSENILGQVVVPSVEMSLPIYKSLTNETLMAGSAVMKHNQTMGKGNYAIAGHYTHTSDNLFGPLRDVQVGDIIRLTDKDKIYEYVTTDIQVVPSTALYMIEDNLAQDYGNAIVSLMQCYYVDFQDTGDRQFFIGELTDVYDFNEDILYASESYEQIAANQAA